MNRRPITLTKLPTLALIAGLTTAWLPSPVQAETQAQQSLRPVTSFVAIEDEAERSRALFLEASKVLTHPRCVNCHPAGDRPLKHDGEVFHYPPVERGADGHGVVGMRCQTCHHSSNFEPAGVPGAPHWHLAPLSMAWEGLTPGEICRQVKDPQRNGGKDLAAIVKHMTDDPLVLWGWQPGSDREPAPGSAAAFAQLIAAWAETGAECPP